MRERKSGIISWLTTRRPATRTPSLGGRELAILEVLWQQGSAPPQRVLEQLGDARIGLSTVQSTLERLYRKQLLMREKQARAYVYTPRVTRQALIASLLHDITAELAGGDITPVVSGFADYLGAQSDNQAPALRESIEDFLDAGSSRRGE